MTERRRVDDPETYWLGLADRLDWVRTPSVAGQWSWDARDLTIRWYTDGVLNACHQCLDRHLANRADDTAILWEGDDPGVSAKITYAEAHEAVCRMANVLRARGVGKGDRVVLYMPMVPEAVYAMLACARIGAIHSVVFAGFSPEALASRIEDCGATAVITADEGRRGGKTIPLKKNVDAALRIARGVRTVLTTRVTGAEVAFEDGRDVWWHEARGDASPHCPPEPMAAEDPLFILYTSGSTGTPKGVVHTTGGYMVWASWTHETVFAMRPDDDVYWCTADVGWITGHSYTVYGPLANGCTTLMFEGVPTWPDAGRMWQVVAKHGVTVLYTAPTAIRALMRESDDLVLAHDRSSLRLLGSVGEPINPEAWRWYRDVPGRGVTPIVDTWWQTETGGVMITPLPDESMDKPGAATKPLPGIEAALLDGDGRELFGAADGNLVVTGSWPGQARTVWGDHRRFVDTYFTTFPGRYFTGDGARRDADGDYWITGRVDDVLNVSGHRMGTAEIESALVAHPATAEAAVVGYPHDIKGQGVHCYVILKEGVAASDDLAADLRAEVRRQIGAVATPDRVQIAPALPKTRSGKIMRRILRKIAEGRPDQLGDTSTLAEPGVVDALVDGAACYAPGT